MTREITTEAAKQALLNARAYLSQYFSLVENTERKIDSESFELKNEFDKNEEELKQAKKLLDLAINNILIK